MLRLSHLTNAPIVVVSHKRGTVTYVQRGYIWSNVTFEMLTQKLLNVLDEECRQQVRWIEAHATSHASSVHKGPILGRQKRKAACWFLLKPVGELLVLATSPSRKIAEYIRAIWYC